MQNFDTIVVGGGAAGFFTAINLAQFKSDMRIAILERGKDVLTKVKISGGGRCNVTHAEFAPQELTGYYPRGQKELRGPFHSFMTGDTLAWFEERGVALKIEEDGRIFPVSNSSQSVIDCFLAEAKRSEVQILTNHSLQNIDKQEDHWLLHTSLGDFTCDNLVITTGSNPKIWKLLTALNHQIVSAVPSLFTFNSKNALLKGLAGIAVPATVHIPGTKLRAEGPLLITHWGLSGPAILKLSAWGARELHALKYSFECVVNWLGDSSTDEVLDVLQQVKNQNSKQLVKSHAQFDLPKRLWLRFLEIVNCSPQTRWAEMNKVKLQKLAATLTSYHMSINGKSTFKDEFTTAGGIDLKEIDFKTYQSKKQDNLYLAGEVLNIDGITGGFNFQNAWTGGYIIAKAIANK